MLESKHSALDAAKQKLSTKHKEGKAELEREREKTNRLSEHLSITKDEKASTSSLLQKSESQLTSTQMELTHALKNLDDIRQSLANTQTELGT